jgi:uridine phosphorylase
LEFDDAVPAYIEPAVHVRPREVPLACVVTFFGDRVRRLIQGGPAR